MAALLACSPSFKTPSDSVIRCGGELSTNCPKGYRCDTELELCLPTTSDDSTAPVVESASLTPSRVGPGGTATLELTVNEPLAAPPSVEFVVAGETRRWSVVGSVGQTFRLTYTASGDEQEDTVIAISAVLTDLAGNRATPTLTPAIEFDFTAPLLDAGSIEQRLLAAPDGPLSEVTAVTGGTIVQVRANADEVLGMAELRATPSGGSDPLVFDCAVDGVELLCVYEHPVGATGDGGYSLSTTIEDLVGNRTADIAIPGTMTIDTLAPAAATTAVPGSIVYRREPWLIEADGSLGSRYSILGAAGATEPGALVRIYSATGGIVAETVSIASGPDAGAFGDPTDASAPLLLDGADRETVWVGVIDAAGNEGPVTHVRDVDWVATLAGKVAEVGYLNPHSIELRRRFDLRQKVPAVVIEASGGPVAGVDYVSGGTSGGVLYSTRGAGEWSNRTVLARYPIGLNIAMASDLNTGAIVAFDSEGNTLVHRGSGFALLPTVDHEGDGSPAARTAGAMAFDGNRDQVVLFGGHKGGALGDTWAWNGSGWTDICPASRCDAPEARWHHGMTYDLGRRRVVLHGGRSGAGVLDDTWVWDGVEWSELCADGSCGTPPATDWVRLTYDLVADEILLLGGPMSGETELWSLADGQWTKLCPSESCTSAPFSCYSPAGWAYDLAQQAPYAYLLNAGAGCGTTVDDTVDETWTWTGSQWEKVDEGSSFYPATAAMGSSVVYSSITGTLLRAGGTDARSMLPIDDARTANFLPSSGGGTDWQQVAIVAAVKGPSRCFVYHPEHDIAVRVAGAATRDTVQYWTKHAWSGGLAIPNEMAAASITGAFGGAANEDEVLLLGPESGSSRLTIWGYWVSGGSAGYHQRWKAPADCASPPCAWPSGFDHKMVWNGTEVILFGGMNASYTLFDDTYAFGAGTWDARCTDTSCSPPSGRIGHGLVADTRNGDVYLFGGADFDLTPASVWRYRGGTWQELVALGGPGTRGTPRLHAAVSFDESRGHVLVYGGTNESPFIGYLYPPDCGFQTGSTCGDLWEFDPETATWFEAEVADLEADGGPPPGKNIGVAYIPTRQEHVFSGESLEDQTWVYRAGASSRPAHVFTVAAGAASPTGKLRHAVDTIEVTWVAGGEGELGGASTPGVELLVWLYDHWEPFASSTTASVIAPESVSGQVTGIAETPVTGLFTGPTEALKVAVAPRAPNGSQYATVVSDYVEVRLRYIVESP